MGPPRFCCATLICSPSNADDQVLRYYCFSCITDIFECREGLGLSSSSAQYGYSQVSILGPVGYGPTTLPLRHSDSLVRTCLTVEKVQGCRPAVHNIGVALNQGLPIIISLVLMLLLNVRQLDAVVPTDCIFITVNQSLEKSNCKEQLKKKIMLVWIHRWPHSKY
ncbi:hypothetical protein V6N11_070659 [Hibiscus sabdariffa]|uniref:Uncharacterized protein n=1 Tax=Hibiscus sabdariffa TaxID=183260 RepID=A0ABR2QG57_9ROSI